MHQREDSQWDAQEVPRLPAGLQCQLHRLLLYPKQIASQLLGIHARSGDTLLLISDRILGSDQADSHLPIYGEQSFYEHAVVHNLVDADYVHYRTITFRLLLASQGYLLRQRDRRYHRLR